MRRLRPAFMLMAMQSVADAKAAPFMGSEAITFYLIASFLVVAAMWPCAPQEQTSGGRK